jgi:hypothetical protein
MTTCRVFPSAISFLLLTVVFERFHCVNGQQAELTDDTIRSAVDLWIQDSTLAERAYGGNISAWDTSQVTNMSGMFDGRAGFNDDISRWDVSSCFYFYNMFRDARNFNANISNWRGGDFRNTFLVGMFQDAWSFRQDLSSWDVTGVSSFNRMLPVR